MPAVSSMMEKLAAAGFEVVWLGNGLNAAHSRVHCHVASTADHDLLSRVRYYKTDSVTGQAMWPEVCELAGLPGLIKNKQVALVGSFYEDVKRLPDLLKSMANIPEIKIVVLHLHQPLLEFSPSSIEGWSGCFAQLTHAGYVMAMVQKAGATTEVAKVIEKRKQKHNGKRMAVTPELSVSDEFAGLHPVRHDAENPKVQAALDVLAPNPTALQFVDASKKRPHPSTDPPRPSKTSKVLVASPDFGVRHLTGNDFLKLKGFPSGSINMSVLTDSQQQSLVGKSPHHSEVHFCIYLATSLTKMP